MESDRSCRVILPGENVRIGNIPDSGFRTSFEDCRPNLMFKWGDKGGRIERCREASGPVDGDSDRGSVMRMRHQ